MTREKAIKIMRKEIECLSHSRCRDCILEKVCDPNTNPTDDEYIEAFGMAINSLEIDERYELEYEQIESCEDAISRQTVQDYIAKYLSQFLYDDVRQAVEVIDEYIGELPSVNPQELKTGHWIEHPEIETSTPEYLMFYECSECGDKQCFCKSDIHKKRFCNNCGAKMVEPQESEDKE